MNIFINIIGVYQAAGDEFRCGAGIEASSTPGGDGNSKEWQHECAQEKQETKFPQKRFRSFLGLPDLLSGLVDR
ncbi:hypothetical protein [Rhizobium sp. BR 314]|uniref:hypothetical protein n=1 Tax=Rhizobium sp. BR 314 TaxID=3040013 RepID=UPI0039BF673A